MPLDGMFWASPRVPDPCGCPEVSRRGSRITGVIRPLFGPDFARCRPPGSTDVGRRKPSTDSTAKAATRNLTRRVGSPDLRPAWEYPNVGPLVPRLSIPRAVGG